MENIHKRRSVREFKKDSFISSEHLITLVKAAMQAPSSKGQRPWEFIIIDNQTVLRQLSRDLPRSECLYDAGAAILVVGNLAVVNTPFHHLDLAAATQNILLAATSLNLGSCWLAVYNTTRQEYVTKYFNLPKQIEPFALIALGELKNVDDLRHVDHYNPKVVHFNRW